jgi:hypothetical protein
MATDPGSSDTILAVGIELLGVGLLTVLAGASDEAGNIVVIFMIGLWLIFMITDSGVIAGLGRGLANVASQAQGNG